MLDLSVSEASCRNSLGSSPVPHLDSGSNTFTASWQKAIVIATARRGHERLQSLKDAGAAILDLDVTASQEELDAIIKKALAIYGGIDVLVNNAGYIEAALIEELEYALVP